MASVDLPVQVTPLLPVSATPSDLLKNENENQLSSPALGFIFQSACHLHRYTRNDSDAHIVERADRLRSVFMGIAVAHGRLLANDVGKGKGKEKVKQAHDETDLEDLLNNLNINAPKSIFQDWPFSIASTPRRLPFTAEAVKFAHGEAYSARLAGYISDVSSKHAKQESEVPEPLSQGDLYLCQESLEAMEGALGACCEAVDDVCKTTSTSARRFVSIRPPGHHCETEGPMGFCWLNNVAVAAAYGK
jgi:histone deacetylase HOS3